MKYKIIIPQEEPKRKIDSCRYFNLEIGCVKDICKCEQEEPKQAYQEEQKELRRKLLNLIDNLEKDELLKLSKEEPKQETTLEEVAKWSLEKAKEFALERFKSDRKKGIVTWDSILEVLKVGVKTGHKFGAKWQAERMYSEEEVYDLLVEWTAYQNGFPRVDEDEIPNGFMSFNQWFEQFSKLKNG